MVRACCLCLNTDPKHIFAFEKHLLEGEFLTRALENLAKTWQNPEAKFASKSFKLYICYAHYDKNHFQTSRRNKLLPIKKGIKPKYLEPRKLSKSEKKLLSLRQKTPSPKSNSPTIADRDSLSRPLASKRPRLSEPQPTEDTSHEHSEKPQHVENESTSNADVNFAIVKIENEEPESTFPPDPNLEGEQNQTPNASATRGLVPSGLVVVSEASLNNLNRGRIPNLQDLQMLRNELTKMRQDVQKIGTRLVHLEIVLNHWISNQ